MQLDIQAIQELLPHRYPLLLVDRIVEMEENRIVGLKNVTMNEPHFAGHFPGHPVMPGVLIIEAMAQTAGVYVLSRIPDRENKLVFFATIENAKFRRPVVPGDQLRIEVTFLKLKPTVAKMRGVALVDGVVAAEAEMMCRLIDKNPGAPEPAHADSSDGNR
jgi:3-hydroxyacyl-[acyl-carrier-protein] dehydratase